MNKKIITVLLLIFVVVIWGITIKRYTDNVYKTNDTTKNLQQIKSTSMYDTQLLKKVKILNSEISLKHLRDPFIGTLYAKPDVLFSRKKNHHNRLVITQPAYLLQGIVWDKHNPSAILVKNAKIGNSAKIHKIGETVIVKKGDKIDYGKVESISKEFVVITTYNNKFKLWSNKWIKIK